MKSFTAEELITDVIAKTADAEWHKNKDELKQSIEEQTGAPIDESLEQLMKLCYRAGVGHGMIVCLKAVEGMGGDVFAVVGEKEDNHAEH